MTPEETQKQALEWQEKANKERQKLVQLKQAVVETEAQINGLEGGILFAQALIKKEEQIGSIDLTKSETAESN
jgi:cell division protein FtsB